MHVQTCEVCHKGRLYFRKDWRWIWLNYLTGRCRILLQFHGKHFIKPYHL